MQTSNHLIFVCCILLMISACDTKQTSVAETPMLRLVRTMVVTAPAELEWQEFPGVVDAAQTAEIGFRVAGKLAQLLVNEGDHVNANQLLAKLDDTDFRIQVKSRQAEYQQAHADFERAQKLVQSGAISRSDYTKLEAQNATAEAALSAARQNLTYTELRAPFAGIMARRHVNNFEEVSAFQPVYTVHDISSLAVKVDIPERVMINADRNNAPQVSARFDTIPGLDFPLEIREITTTANTGSNTYQVTFSMPRADGYNILPGMSVTLRALSDSDRQAGRDEFFVPAQAVLETGDGRHVFIAKPLQEGTASVERRVVKTGRLTSSGLSILDGLSVGDRVIIAGMSRMYPGLKVRLGEE
ncbi:MAG: efflux RND transporter periplasmic adaptor subunit [Gammaproteobacteria bacterium]|nr:efflux RND transporter periplasmic adaptor subunit [Gammaproteobacteria bacterium]